MIPVKLTMRNFMCYRQPPPLDFSGISTACISGDNGNGKSAIIDAMTWAVWRKSRAGSDDDLIYQGEAEMAVEFDFSAGGQLYRIIRRHARPRRQKASGESSLELLVQGAEGFKVISGNIIRETEAKIVRDIVHMDYETFISSAFLRQGHADEFTRQPPARRKDVLAAILGLSVYDALEEQARNLSRQRAMEKAAIEAAVKEIDIGLSEKATCEEGLCRAKADLGLLEKEASRAETERDRRRQEKESLAARQVQLSQVEEAVAALESESRGWEEQAATHNSRLREYADVIAKRAEVERGYGELVRVRKLDETLDRKLRERMSLEGQRHQLEMAVLAAQGSLTTEHSLTRNRISELEERLERLAGLKEALKKIEAKRLEIAGGEEALAASRREADVRRGDLSELGAAGAELEKDTAELDEKLRLLLAQAEAKCPLCETELGQDRIRLIEAKYGEEREKKARALESARGQAARQRDELKALEAGTSRMEKDLEKARAAIQAEASVLAQQAGEAETAAQRLGPERETLAEIERRLAQKDFAHAEHRALREVEAALSRLDYDGEEHERVRQILPTLEPFEESRIKLEEALRRIEAEKEAAARAEEALGTRRADLSIQRQRREQLKGELESLPGLASGLAEAEVAYQGLAARQMQARDVFSAVKARLDRCLELETRRKEKAQALKAAANEENIYSELARAFGKEGIQAMLIETALPEIENGANALLARMTDNRMHVKFETQRPKKAGGTIETLDINVSDELGARPYEMFSGGEAFRINFAVRIALSELLARRAGAPLRTLIIDEGFGTLDSQGLEKIKEAIASVQEDFDRILVITHIEELRDAFPTRIDVVKTAEGSTIEVS